MVNMTDEECLQRVCACAFTQISWTMEIQFVFVLGWFLSYCLNKLIFVPIEFRYQSEIMIIIISTLTLFKKSLIFTYSHFYMQALGVGP